VIELSPTTALLVVDMQNGYCHADGFMAKIGLDFRPSRDAVAPVTRLVAAVRAAGLPVFLIAYELSADYSDAGLLAKRRPQIKEAGGMIRGSWDAAIVDALAPAPGDRVLTKTRHSAFYGTDLEDQLAALSVDTVIVCGVTTNVCVESTVRDAYFRDIEVLVPSDATAAVTPEMHTSALRNFQYSYARVTTVAELEQALAAGQLAAG
jgi:ureidoacrylate peracid hydrolase